MAELAISKEFLSAYARLPRSARRAADAVFGKFAQHTHAGMHLEKLTNARDSRIRTIRVDRFYRGVILALDGDNHIWYTVLPHDDAIAYAISRRFTVNEAIGVLEVRDQERIDDRLAQTPALPTPTLGLFEKVTDSDLRRLGIDAQLLPLVRVLNTDKQLDGLRYVLPDAQFDVLTGLAAGMSADEVWPEVAERIVAEHADPDDLLAAARRTPEKIKFVSGPEELASILARPFDLWRTFLHPTQHEVAYRKVYAGPAYITGSAGTGKTVTGLHRAVFLAKLLPAEGSKVLITTFTRALAKTLERQLHLLTTDRAVLGRIEVLGVDQLAYEVVHKARGGRPKIAEEKLVRGLFATAAKEAPSYFDRAGNAVAYSGAFLQREWEQVILAQQLSTMDAYRDAPRRGRGGALRADQRDRVWSLVDGVVAQLAKLGQRTHLQLADDGAAIAVRPGLVRYPHIIVDEGQDLHPAQWRLLRALVPPGPNDLFILADPHQRIYESRVTLASLGIEMRGRSRRLTVNYRTTHEILDWSIKVLTGEQAVGLDGAEDSLSGYRSVTRGQRPALAGHPDRLSELDALVEQVGRWLDQGVEPHAIGVAARTNYLVEDIAKTFREAHIPVADDAAGVSGVHVATMHGMKGLEFQCLAVTGLTADVLPAPHAVTAAAEDPVAHRQDLQRERCLLFVAATRARDMLYLSHAGTPSPLLPA